MEVDFKLYFWFCKLGLFEDSDPRDERTKFLSKAIAQKFSSGFLMGRVLNALKETVKADVNKQTNFGFVKDTVNEEEIRQNWNFILAVLDHGFNIRLDSKTREIVMEGDKTMICEVFNILYEKYHTLDRGFKEELLKHEMNILDDPILRQPSSKPVKPHADNSHMRSSSINPDSRDFKDDPVPDNEALQGLEEELGIDEASNLAAMTARRRTKEESSIMLNQTLVSANNSSVMDTSLAFNTSVLAFKSKQLEPINFKVLDKKTDLETLTKATEIIVVILARNLNRSPFEMAFLLVEKMSLLTKLMIVGKKKDYSCIVKVFEDFYSHADRILSLALTDETRETLSLFLDIVRMGFVSKDEQVTKWTINTTGKIVYLLAQKELSSEIYQILVKDNKFIPMILLAIKRHEGLYKDLIGLMTMVARENLEDLFNVELRRYLPQGYGFFKITHEYLKALMAETITADSLENLRLVQTWTQEAIEACKPGQGNSVNTQIYAIFMLIDMWRHFPKKFKDSIVQDQVLEEIKNSLRMHQVSSIQTVAIFGQLVGLFEFIVEQKLDQYGKVTADKIANLILHVLMDFNPANTAVKEFMLEQAFLLLKKDLLDLNECIRVFLRIFQNMSNAFGVSDVKIVGYLMSRVDDLSDKNLLNLLDFNCHLFMNDTCAMDFSKQNIVTLTGFLKQNDSVITHFVKFIRLVFNWLYKTRLSHNKGPHPELNAAREKQMLDLIRLLLYSEKTNLRIWVVAHNMAALTNFQLRKYLGTRRSRTKDPFVDGYRPLILAPNPLDTRNPEAEKLTPEEIMLRFDRVFELHLNDTAGKELEGQLDKLVTSVDLCKKFQPDDLEFTQGDDLADYPRVESELSRHKARMEALKKKEEKLQKIKQGVFADKKAIHQLSLIREKRVQKEHDKIQTEAQKSIIELEQVNKYAKQAEDIKILTGTRKEDAVELTIEQLTKPLGTHQ